MLIAQTDNGVTVLERMDPLAMVSVLMALFALVLVGMGLIGMTMLGARWVRRIGDDRKPARAWPSRRKFDPPAPMDSQVIDDQHTSETLRDRRPDDTVSED